MNRKIYIQFLLLSIILVMVTSIYLIYFNKNKKNYVETVEESKSNKIVKGSEDLISEISILFLRITKVINLKSNQIMDLLIQNNLI